MRRWALVLSAVVLLGSLLIGSRTAVTAKEFPDHPLVGAWSLVTDDQSLPDVITFGADGNVVDLESDGTISLGAWEPTGDSTANLTVTVYSDEEGGYWIRAAIEVAADGQSFTASYTFELFDPASGKGMGQYGPASATGTRLPVEGPGTPVGSIEDLFGQFAGTPSAPSEATPVADLTDNVVQVTLTEFAIQADQPTLTAGQEYTFAVTNAGAIPHELVIEPTGIVDKPLEQDGHEAEVANIEAGTTEQLTWTFSDPGTYQFACHVPGHYEKGMVLQFEVVAP